MRFHTEKSIYQMSHITRCVAWRCRNQKALAFLLKNPAMPFQYDTILSLLREETIPALVRAR